MDLHPLGGSLSRLRLLVLSDLHLEFAGFDPPPGGYDAVLLAGDIGNGTAGIEWAGAAFAGRPVFYVPGNHEYYDDDWEALRPRLRDSAAASGVHLLDCAEAVLGDVRIAGCTLWTDFDLYGEARRAESMRASLVLADYRAIRDGGPLLRPERVRERHLAERAWLADCLARTPPGVRSTVVVTHMLPSLRSVSQRFRPMLSSAGFASHVDELLAGADLWIHGHTHDSADYTVGRCRVRCNPRGYLIPGRPTENPRFDPALVLEA